MNTTYTEEPLIIPTDVVVARPEMLNGWEQ